MSITELRHIENLARIAGNLDEEPGLNMPGPTRWGPASWWRIGLVVLALFIGVLALYPAFG